jgi:LysR family transcriptional activator of nhaA
VPTEAGRLAYRFADEIFGLGRELIEVVQGRAPGRLWRLAVGIVDAVPKLVAHRLLEPAFARAEGLRIVCHEDHAEPLLARLALHELDLVISDAPIGPQVKVRGFSHLLGECGVTAFAAPALAAAHRRGFPRSLDGAPALLPTENTALRRALDAWFEARGLRPRVVGEFEDSALLKVFGQPAERRLSHPAVQTITETARSELFGD